MDDRQLYNNMLNGWWYEMVDDLHPDGKEGNDICPPAVDLGQTF